MLEGRGGGDWGWVGCASEWVPLGSVQLEGERCCLVPGHAQAVEKVSPPLLHTKSYYST